MIIQETVTTFRWLILVSFHPGVDTTSGKLEQHVGLASQPHPPHLTAGNFLLNDRGSTQTETMRNQRALIHRCIAYLSSKFDVDSSTIKTDMDAFSILMSTNEMTPPRMAGMKEFLSLFGNELTLRTTLPNSVVGSSREGVFGCREDEKCMHLPTRLQDREALVTSTPVKIAVHRSCKERLWENLKSKDIHFTLSKNGGLCFNPKRAANQANYEKVVEAIVESCGIVGRSHHVIHVADFGCKLDITPGERDCPLGKIFTGLKMLAQLGVRTDVTQLDIGFRVPTGNNKVPNYSWDRGNQNAPRQSGRMFKHVAREVYPTHLMYANVNGQDVNLAKIRGTLSLKKKREQWEKKLTAGDVIRIEHGNEDLNECHCMIGHMYSCEQENNENLMSHVALSPNSVHNLKIYSSIVHEYLQQRENFMMKHTDYHGVGTRNMKNLSEYVKRVEDAALNSLRYHLNHCTVYSRVEVSIRFPTWDRGMRRVGHYTDYLVHALLAVNELCAGESHSFSIHFHDPVRLATQVKNMAREVLSYLRFRQSLSFNHVYKNERITNWLRMMLSLMLITAGLVPQPRLKWIRDFCRDKDRFDPYGRASHLNTATPRYKKKNEIQPASGVIRGAFRKLLRELGFSRSSRELLTEFTFNLSSSGKNIVSVYNELRISDKLLLARWLTTEILPLLSKSMAKTNHNDDSGTPQINRTHHEMADVWQPHHLGISKENPPGDAVSLGMNKLSGFATLTDVRGPVLTAILCKFILIHHHHRCLQNSHRRNNRDVSASLQLDDSVVDVMNSHIDKGAAMSNAHWQRLYTNLNIRPRATHQTRDFYITCICKHLLFPCQGVHYGDNIVPERRLNQKNNFLRESFLSVVRTTNFGGKTIICRNGGTEIIRISKRSDVLEQKELSSTTPCGSGFGYDVLCSISESATESDPDAKDPNNEKHRKLMKRRLTHQTEDLCDLFLTDQGQVIEQFKHTVSLTDLESKHNFLLEHSTNLSMVELCTSFSPRVIIPIYAFVTETSLAYYDSSASKTCIYTCQQGKCILYEEDSLYFAPKESCFIIRHDGPKYTWCKHHHDPSQSIAGRLSVPPREEYSSSLMYARTSSGSNVQTAVHGSNRNGAKSLMTSLRLLIQEQCNSQQELPPPRQVDSLALIPFLQQLFAHHPPTSRVYHESVTDNCRDLLLSAMNIVNILEKNDASKITHQFLCPIICLKYKVIIGVFFRSGRKQRTAFYFYEPSLKMVMCRNVETPGYHTLAYYQQTIYISVGARGSTRRYTPTTYTPETHRSYSYFKTIRHKFFHVDLSVLLKMIETLAQEHHMHFQPKDQIVDIEGGQRTVMTLTTVRNTGTGTPSLDALRHMNIEHFGLILIFPYSEPPWEACIVHHPSQDESAVLSNMNSFITQLHRPPDLSISLVKGKIPEDCELGLYMLMYAYIADKTSSVKMFSDAVYLAHQYSDLDHKLREWLFVKYTQDNRSDYVPFWLESIVRVHL